MLDLDGDQLATAQSPKKPDLQQRGVAYRLQRAAAGQVRHDPLQVFDWQRLDLLLRAAMRARDPGQCLAHCRRRRWIGEGLVDVPLRQRRQAQGQGARIEGRRGGEQVADDRRLVGRQHAAPRQVVVHGGAVGLARVIGRGCGQYRSVLGGRKNS